MRSQAAAQAGDGTLFLSGEVDPLPRLPGLRVLGESEGPPVTAPKAVVAHLAWEDAHHAQLTDPTLTNLSTDQYNVNDGIGRVRGLEVLVRHAPIDRLFGWVSYTLSRSERCDDVNADACARDFNFADDNSDWYLFDFDQTHIFTTVAGYTLPYEIEVSGLSVVEIVVNLVQSLI